MDKRTVATHWGDALDQQIADQEAQKHAGRIVAPATEMAWVESKMGRDALAVSPTTGFALKTMHGHFDEILPRGKTGLHRHASEAIMLCLSGRGYSVVDGVRHDWGTGDCFVMPSGSWHQHFNLSDSELIRYFAVSNWPLTVAAGLSYQEFREFSERYQSQ